MSKWEWKKLGEVCEIHGRIGWQGLTRKEYRSSGDYLLITGINFTDNNTVDYESCVYVDKERYVQDQYIQVRENDLLITKDGTLGKLALIAEMPPKPATLNGGLFVIRNPDNKIYPKFLMYVMKSEPFRKMIRKSITGSTVPHLTQNMLVNFPIPIPSLSEQRSIVKQLDEKLTKIEKIKTNAETNLKNAKELFYAELKKTFHEKGSWKTVQLGEIALEYGRGKSKHRPRNDECLFGGEYPFIQTGDIRNSGKYVVDYTETYNEIGLAQSKLWQKGTLCITIAANIAETAILTFPCCFPDSVIGFVPNEQYSSVDFIYYVILYFRTELQKISKGAAQDNLNLAKLESMNFPLPPLSVQKEIVARLDKLSENVKRLEANYKQIIANCDELKKSILKKTFERES